ncbi:hypothetical protein ACFX16_009467 [Malus domestica]
MKGTLMPFYRAAKPISKTSMQYSSIAIATSKVKPSQATTSPAYSVGYTVHGQDYVMAALKDRGYQAYMDEDDLNRREEIKEELFRAIVGKQDEDLAQAFQNHEKDIRDEKDDKKREAKQGRVKLWREALTKATNLFDHQTTGNRRRDREEQ